MFYWIYENRVQTDGRNYTMFVKRRKILEIFENVQSKEIDEG